MPNLRSRDAYRDRAWDWEFLNDSLPGKIRVSDFDGIVEIHGRFLAIEAKPAAAGIPTGQKILLDQLAAQPNWNVLVIYGEPNLPVAMQRWPGPPQSATESTVQDFVCAWSKWAKRQGERP